MAVYCDLTCFPPDFADKANAIFLRPKPLSWDEIVPRAVAQNTFRGFHKVAKDLPGAKVGFVGYFLEQRRSLVDALSEVGRRDELHKLGNRVCGGVRARLGNCRASQLASYNKVRKLVDLYFEHLVAMAVDLDHLRSTLVPLLFLPLDSWIIRSQDLFSDDDLVKHGLSRASTYSAITAEANYSTLQELIGRKAELVAVEHGLPFYPIYFDLLWQDRYKRGGENLFDSNP